MIACVPIASTDVVHAAVGVLPPPASAIAVQPAIAAPLSANCTRPVGALPVTVAVSVTAAPNVAGLAELVTAVVVAARAGPIRTSSTKPV